jgi:Cu/Ag efflux protein CusF
MKKIFVVALVFVIALVDMYLFVRVGLANEELDSYPQKKLSVQQQGGEHSQLRIFATAGIVKKIDPENGIVTIFLDPVPDLKWSSMIRIFSVTDKSVFERFKVGEKLKFEFERDESNEMVIDLK